MIEKFSTLSYVRFTISTKEEAVNMDKIFRKLYKQTNIFHVLIFFDDETFDDVTIYYLFTTITHEKFKVIYSRDYTDNGTLNLMFKHINND